MMKKLRLLLAFTAVPFILLGCAILMPPVNTTMDEERIVKPFYDQEKQVVFKHPMVWYDKMNPSRGILFPEGSYSLEAEDKEYYYFKAPKEFECRAFNNGETIDTRFISGGLFLSKDSSNVIPAGAYYTISDEKKTLSWKLGSDFMRMKGTDWEKRFKGEPVHPDGR